MQFSSPDYRRGDFDGKKKKKNKKSSTDDDEDEDCESKRRLLDVTTTATAATTTTTTPFNGTPLLPHLAPSYENTTFLSQTNSPFIDKKINKNVKKQPLMAAAASALALSHPPQGAAESPHAKSKSSTALLPQPPSPTRSEHQYDIPFSHLTPATQAKLRRDRDAAKRAAKSLRNQQHQHHSSLSLSSSNSNLDYDDVDRIGGHRPPRPSFLANRKAAAAAGVIHSASSTPQQRRSQHSSSGTNGSVGDLGHFGWVGPNRGGGLNGDTSSLLQPRLIIDGGFFKPNGGFRGGWGSGSDKSLNTSHYSEVTSTSRPVSSLFNEMSLLRSKNQPRRTSLTSDLMDPSNFTFAKVTSTGVTLSLPELGVSLSVPEGAVEPGFTEEVFLAVTTDESGRDRPRLSANQTLVSPVVLVGPPRLDR